jgi:hypothetical protein
MAQEKPQLIPTEQIMNKIFLLREEKVMLDVYLAEIYGVETRTLKQAVRRNMDLFPDDFMFVLTDNETGIMVSQNVIPSRKSLGGSNPFAFTELCKDLHNKQNKVLQYCQVMTHCQSPARLCPLEPKVCQKSVCRPR